MERRAGTVSELRAEIIAIGLELLNQCRSGAQADVQFFQRVVVNEIELNILVPAALAALGVGLAQQIEFGALTLVNGSRCRAGFWLGCAGRSRFRTAPSQTGIAGRPR